MEDSLSRGKEGALWVAHRVGAVPKVDQAKDRVDRAGGTRVFSKEKARIRDTLAPLTWTELLLVNLCLKARSSIPLMSMLKKDKGDNVSARASAGNNMRRMKSLQEEAIHLRECLQRDKVEAAADALSREVVAPKEKEKI